MQLLDLARTIATLMGHPDIRIRPSGTSFAGDTARWYADITKARAFGFAPLVDLHTGLRRTIAWLSAHPAGAGQAS